MWSGVLPGIHQGCYEVESYHFQLQPLVEVWRISQKWVGLWKIVKLTCLLFQFIHVRHIYIEVNNIADCLAHLALYHLVRPQGRLMCSL